MACCSVWQAMSIGVSWTSQPSRSWAPSNKRTHPASGVPAVLVDARTAGTMAVEHLVDLGHRRIGLLSATASTDTYRDHKAGFIEALDRHGIRVGRELVWP